MLRLRTETLSELTADDLVSVVGGSCVVASCVTGGIPPIYVHTTFTQSITRIEGTS